MFQTDDSVQLTNNLAQTMTTLRDFHLLDLLSFNKVNLDPLTETYSMSFYMMYMARWPEYFRIAKSMNGDIMGYSEFVVAYILAPYALICD